MTYTIETKDDSTWLVHYDDGAVIEVYFTKDSLYMIDKDMVLLLESEDDLEEILEKGTLSEGKDRCVEYYIGGYRVTNAVPTEEIIIDGVDLPLYKRNSKSDVVYAAGYYCVKYDTGWKHGSSILLSTLKKYDYRGPFHTMEKAFSVMQEVRKEK